MVLSDSLRFSSAKYAQTSLVRSYQLSARMMRPLHIYKFNRYRNHW